MRDQEYDRFGPWVLEISESDPPPPMFRSYVTDDAVLLRVKIPRQVERRNVRPGMNLYDYMVSLFEYEIEILERVDDEVKQSRMRYSDIQRIVHGEDLLAGRILLVTENDTCEIRFKTVSSDLMGRIIAILRQRYADDARPLEIGSLKTPNTDVQSFYHKGLLRGLRSESPHVRLLAFQDETPVGRHDSGILRRVFLGLVGKRLLESLYLTDGRELEFMDQGRTYRYRGFAVYERNTHYVPISKIRGISWSTPDNDRALVQLNLDVPDGPLTFTLARDNPTVPALSSALAAIPGFEAATLKSEELVKK